MLVVAVFHSLKLKIPFHLVAVQSAREHDRVRSLPVEFQAKGNIAVLQCARNRTGIAMAMENSRKLIALLLKFNGSLFFSRRACHEMVHLPAMPACPSAVSIGAEAKVAIRRRKARKQLRNKGASGRLVFWESTTSLTWWCEGHVNDGSAKC